MTASAAYAAKLNRLIDAEPRFGYFATPEFERRLLVLDEFAEAGGALTTKKMAAVAGCPRDLFVEFVHHFKIADDMVRLYAGNTPVELPR